MSDYETPDRATTAFVRVMEIDGNDADALEAACRVAVAEGYRQMADTFEATQQEWRRHNPRVLRASGLGHAVKELRSFADALDPEGVQRARPCGQCSALPHRPHRDDCPEVIGV